VELIQGSDGAVERANVCVCICTFKRPELLATLLKKLEQQQLKDELTMSVVVADNDKHRSGEASVIEARARGRLAIVYCVEPEQNIAKARNAALRHAKGEYLAFIDDDEVPDDQWLVNAVRFCRAADVDGMLGPVRPYFQHQPPAWLTKGRFCERPEPATGHVLPWRETRTGNVLLRAALVERDAEPFAVAFGAGGEDQEFFKRLIARGAVLQWCNEAPVYELVPPERCRRRYLLQRALRRGQSEKGLADGKSIAKSMVAVPAYALALPVSLLIGHHHFVRNLVRLCDHLGKLLGIAGFRPMGKHYVNP
jgi:succinoglycan biosynthesis protein ExoM